MFSCEKSILKYECCFCHYATHEKAKKSKHKCGFVGYGEGPVFKRCRRCKMSSYSFVWRSHHKKKCVINNFLQSTKQKLKTLLEKPIECDQCDFKTNKNKYIEQHKKSNHNQQGLQLNLSNYSQLTIEKFENLPARPVECDQCNFKTSKNQYLRQHKRSKHNPIFLQSVLNHYSLLTKEKLKTEEPVACDECDFKTSKSKYLKQHKQRNHSQECLQCSDCDYKTNQKSHLKRHKIRKHTPIQMKTLSYCDECGYSNYHKENLALHKKRNHGQVECQKWFQCDECEHKAKQKGHLKLHKERKHSLIDSRKLLQCDQCEYTVGTKANLKHHKNSKHTLPELQAWFQCNDCKYKSNNKNNLIKHIKVKHSIKLSK